MLLLRQIWVASLLIVIWCELVTGCRLLAMGWLTIWQWLFKCGVRRLIAQPVTAPRSWRRKPRCGNRVRAVTEPKTRERKPLSLSPSVHIAARYASTEPHYTIPAQQTKKIPYCCAPQIKLLSDSWLHCHIGPLGLITLVEEGWWAEGDFTFCNVRLRHLSRQWVSKRANNLRFYMLTE